MKTIKDSIKRALTKGVNNAVDNAGTAAVAFVGGSVAGTAWLPQLIAWFLGLVGAG